MGISTERFEEFVSLIAQTLGHVDRVEPLRLLHGVADAAQA